MVETSLLLKQILEENKKNRTVTLNAKLKKYGFRVCKFCGEVKPINEFATTRSLCNTCEENKQELKRSGLSICNCCYKVKPTNELINGKCKPCIDLIEEWKHRERTQEEKELYKFAPCRFKPDIPKFKKVYSIYAYDLKKYHKIWKKIYNLSIKYGLHIHHKTNKYKVLSHCFIKDECGNKISLGDEKHIFRYAAYHRILEALAEEFISYYDFYKCPDTMLYLMNRTHLILFIEEKEKPLIELFEFTSRDIKERIKAHITILRLLRRHTLEIEEIINLVKAKYQIKPLKEKNLQLFNTVSKIYNYDIHHQNEYN